MNKPYTCWTCGETIKKPTKDTRKACSHCGGRWDKPNFGERLGWAWESFNWKPRKQIRRLSREEVLTTIPITASELEQLK